MDQPLRAEFRVIEPIPRATIVHHVDHRRRVYLSFGRQIACLTESRRTLLGTFPRVFPRDFFNFHRLAQRASRSDKCNVYANRHGHVLAIRAEAVYAVKDGQLRRIGKIQGDRVLHDSFAEDDDGCIYFGEYFDNAERRPVRIWRTNAELSRVDVAHEFSAGKVRHVHGVFRDPFDPDAFWITAGDSKDECCVIKTDLRFQSMIEFGDGSQKWRAVKLFFTPTHLCWITDTELEQNFACRMDRQTGQLEFGQKVDCSGWYGFQTHSGYYVAGTTVETGPGIQSDQSSLLVSRDGFHWQVAAQFRKDAFRPMSVFKYGVISFPSGQFELQDFYLSGEGLQELDGRVVRCALDVS